MGSRGVIELYMGKTQDMLRIRSDLFYLVWFDKARIKANHHNQVKGQEEVTRDHFLIKIKVPWSQTRTRSSSSSSSSQPI